MKKLILFFSVLSLSYASCLAQSDMIIRKGEKGFYLEHKVAAKENFYSIGRIYDAHPKEIAAFNNLDMSKGLSLGQSLRIPLTTNFSQSVDQGVPVFYKVGEKEGLMKVSGAANNVTLANLRKWNNLENDDISFGSKLIVGYLVVPGAAATPVQKEVVTVEKKENEIAVVKKEETVAKENKENQEKNVESKVPPAKEAVKEPIKPATVGSDGYFKTSFVQQTKSTPLSKNETVASGIFKTTSGWQDAKYYLLITGVSPGTIIKVTNPTNNKVVYAKVLGEMSGIQQNEGYKIRISNAAASALNITDDDKFIVKINY